MMVLTERRRAALLRLDTAGVRRKTLPALGDDAVGDDPYEVSYKLDDGTQHVSTGTCKDSEGEDKSIYSLDRNSRTMSSKGGMVTGMGRIRIRRK